MGAQRTISAHVHCPPSFQEPVHRFRSVRLCFHDGIAFPLRRPLEETNHLPDRFSLPGGRCSRPLHRMSPSALLPSMCSPDRWRLCLLLQLSIPVTPCILLSAMEHIDMSESSVLRTFASSKQGRLQAVDVRLGYSSAGLDEVPQQVTFTLRHLPTFVSLQHLARFECSTLTKCSKCRLQPPPVLPHSCADVVFQRGYFSIEAFFVTSDSVRLCSRNVAATPIATSQSAGLSR